MADQSDLKRLQGPYWKKTMGYLVMISFWSRTKAGTLAELATLLSQHMHELPGIRSMRQSIDRWNKVFKLGIYEVTPPESMASSSFYTGPISSFGTAVSDPTKASTHSMGPSTTQRTLANASPAQQFFESIKEQEDSISDDDLVMYCSDYTKEQKEALGQKLFALATNNLELGDTDQV